MSAEWKPIDTAPKDRRILLRIPGRLAFSAGAWDADEYAKKPRPYWRVDAEAWLGKLWMRENQPTHWMSPMESKP